MTIRAAVSILLAVLTLGSISGCGSGTTDPAVSYHSTATGTGYLRKSDTLWILNLEGDYTDMGRQYGALLKNEFPVLFQEMDAAIGFNDTNKVYLTLIAATMAERERQFLTGMSQESGLNDFDKHEFLNAALFFMYNPGCSALAATGPRTESGFTIAGRNFDNPRGTGDKYANLLKGRAILVIYNPRAQFTGLHRDNSVAMMSYFGWFHGLTILNEKGIYLEYNNATNSIPMIRADLPTLLLHYRDGLHKNIYAAFDSDSLDEVDTALSGRVSVANMTQVADKNQVWHYEHSPYENSENSFSRKLLAGQATGRFSYSNTANTSSFTNHFFSDNWGPHQNLNFSLEHDSASKTVARLVNLQGLAGSEARITPEMMKNIMTTRLLSNGGGGPFIEWALGNPDVTHFTTVTDIAGKVMHIYPYVDGDAARWTAVDLNGEFR
ncbi:MAG: hypothetical protein Q8K18_01205 [Burkholderiales bacterium]|nr:hypothetical protein [Burkholderiales bacterium]